MDECPICLETRYLTRVDPCGHGVYPQCLHKQARADARCALCRQIMFGCSPPIVVYAETIHDFCVSFERDAGESVGFFVKNTTDLHNNNTIVSKVVTGSMAEALGIQPAQTLLSINGIPCYTRECTSQILSACKRAELWLKRSS